MSECLGRERCPMWAVCPVRDEQGPARVAGCQDTLATAYYDGVGLATGFVPAEDELAKITGRALAQGSDELAAAVGSLMNVLVNQE